MTKYTRQRKPQQPSMSKPMYTYLITTFDKNGVERARIEFTCDEPDIDAAKALVTLDETAVITVR